MISGLLYGNNDHHLDHLAPLCSLLNIPLIVSDDQIFETAKKLYPNLSLSFVSTFEVGNFILNNLKAVISCFSKAYLDLIFFPNEKIFRENIKSIWCPHGNSDKGLNTTFFSPLANEDCLLVYGSKMLDILKSKNLLKPTTKVIKIGNYRKQYYEKHHSKYQSITKGLDFLKKSKTYLYAPTWEDKEKNSSLTSHFSDIEKYLRPDETLIIKLHPNSLKKNCPQLNNKIFSKEKNHQIHFISNFPPIYPIIDAIDAYIGDFSSIGYDILAYKKPMGFLLSSDKDISNCSLFKCGVKLNKNDYFEKVLHQSVNFDLEKKKLYEYTFSTNTDWKKEIIEYANSSH